MLKVFRLLLCLGLILLQACQKAEQNTEQAIRLQHQQEAASYNTQLGLAYLKRGDRTRAKRKLLVALELAPKSADVNAAMAYFFEKSADISNARAYYQKALSLEPTKGAQLNNFGAFLCRQGQYKKAEGYFLQAAQDIEYLNTAGAYENAGLCVAAIPDYRKASKYFAQALQQDPERKASLYELIAIELKQNHVKAALYYLQKYPELSLNDVTLISLAIEASHRAGKVKIEKEYRLRLSKLNHFTDYTGAKNDNNFNQ